jgi:hypothetical protein
MAVLDAVGAASIRSSPAGTNPQNTKFAEV